MVQLNTLHIALQQSTQNSGHILIPSKLICHEYFGDHLPCYYEMGFYQVYNKHWNIFIIIDFIYVYVWVGGGCVLFLAHSTFLSYKPVPGPYTLVQDVWVKIHGPTRSLGLLRSSSTFLSHQTVYRNDKIWSQFLPIQQWLYLFCLTNIILSSMEN